MPCIEVHHEVCAVVAKRRQQYYAVAAADGLVLPFLVVIRRLFGRAEGQRSEGGSRGHCKALAWLGVRLGIGMEVDLAGM